MKEFSPKQNWELSVRYCSLLTPLENLRIGFLADRSNINRFMTTGLLVTALVNLCLGFTHFFLFCLLSFGGLVAGFSLWVLLLV